MCKRSENLTLHQFNSSSNLKSGRGVWTPLPNSKPSLETEKGSFPMICLMEPDHWVLDTQRTPRPRPCSLTIVPAVAPPTTTFIPGTSSPVSLLPCTACINDLGLASVKSGQIGSFKVVQFQTLCSLCRKVSSIPKFNCTWRGMT